MSNIVSIVGRPNVGKSTLFNRLVEKRQAIIHDESGVTRDRHYGISEWNGKSFTVIDTGGYVENTEDIFENKIKDQVVLALNESSIILFMVDCKNGLSTLDIDFAKVVRQINKDVIIVANKADNYELELNSNEFYELGLSESQIIPISSISGSGTGELLDLVVKKLDSDSENKNENLPRISILGRPNVGKSTLFNRIVRERKSIVSPEEGVTRDRIYGSFDWQGKMFDLIDTGGYIPNSEDMIENQVRLQAEIAFREADAIILLMDGRNNLTSSDLILAKQVQKSGKPYILAINKIDKLEMDDLATQFYELGLGDYFTLSAQNNRSVGDLLDGVLDVLPDRCLQEVENEYDLSLAIVGMPNVGKSSLMNCLLKENKSIVTNIAGTTRDSIDSYIKYHKKDFNL